MTRPFIYLLALVALTLGTSCLAEYDPPPQTTLVQPEKGSFEVGDSVTLTFSETISKKTFKIRVWPDQRNKEGEFDTKTTPLVKTCQPGGCGEDLKATFGEDGKSVVLEFNKSTLGKAGTSMYLEVLPGLEDMAGNDTGIRSLFNLSFKLAGDSMRMNTEPVPFDDGPYILVGEIAKPIPATLNLVGEINVDEAGNFALAMAEGDHLGDAPKNTSNPAELEIDATPTGFAIFITGFVFYRNGERLLETDPTDIAIPLGFLDVSLKQVRLNGKIIKNPETGKDRIESSLTFEGLDIIRRGKITSYPGDAAALAGDWIEPGLMPAGYPKVCGDDKCGAVLGTCMPPAPFPQIDTICE